MLLLLLLDTLVLGQYSRTFSAPHLKCMRSLQLINSIMYLFILTRLQVREITTQEKGHTMQTFTQPHQVVERIFYA